MQRLQVLVPLVPGVGQQLGRLRALLLGLPRRLRPQLGDLAFGGGPQRGHLALDGRLQLGDLVRGRGAQLLGLPLRVRPQRVRLPARLYPYLGRLALGPGAQVARLPLGGRLHGRRLGARLVGDLAGLQPGRRDDALGLPLGLAPVVVGLLLGQPQDLLDASAETRQGRSAVLLELLAGVGEPLLDRVEPLLGLAQATLPVLHPLVGLGAGLLRLDDGVVETPDLGIYLAAVVAAENNAELLPVVRVVEERS